MKNQLGMLIGIAIVCLISVQRTETKKVCYKDLGCFYNTQPYYILLIPHFTLPASPKEIGTKFFLYTRQNPEAQQRLKPMVPKTIEDSFFDGEKDTVFIVHGFHSDGNATWVKEMTVALLDIEDLNVIVVDWSRGALHKFARTIANTRVVGAQVAFFIKQLEKYGEGSRLRTHIVGHSQGAHIAGFAGKALVDLSKITGLDPAGPGFDSKVHKMRLHHTDASFVVVIHTNGAYKFGVSFGIRRKLGDVDFYPSGGITQPRCDHDPICSHKLACILFTESIHNYPFAFEGKPCASIEDYERGRCEDCKEGCNPMGYFSTKPEKRTTYYLDTKRKPPQYMETLDPEITILRHAILQFFRSISPKKFIKKQTKAILKMILPVYKVLYRLCKRDRPKLAVVLDENDMEHVIVSGTCQSWLYQGEHFTNEGHASCSSAVELVAQSEKAKVFKETIPGQVYSWWSDGHVDDDDDEDEFPLHLPDAGEDNY